MSYTIDFCPQLMYLKMYIRVHRLARKSCRIRKKSVIMYNGMRSRELALDPLRTCNKFRQSLVLC